MKNWILFLLIYLLSNSEFIASNNILKLGDGFVNPVNVHVIAIGVDKYFGDSFIYKNCIADAKAIVEKIKKDQAPELPNFGTTRGQNKNSTSLKDSFRAQSQGKVFSYVLLNEQATLKNILETLKTIIKKSTTNDYFVFYFAGMTIEVNNGETILIPHIKQSNIKIGDYLKNYKSYDHLSISILANYMNQISATKQLVISEAGQGKIFAENLKSALFESDPDFSVNSERNRIILTTVGIGYDSSRCDKNHGLLVKYILDNGNMLEVFNHYHAYEYDLNKSEIACSLHNSKYYYLTQEKDYKNLLAKHAPYSGTRGSTAKKVAASVSKTDDKVDIYALFIATDTYNREQDSWSDLKNPLNDANTIAEILESKYKVKVNKLYNESRSVIKKGIINLKRQVDENDKIFIFIAGHGHFSEDYGQGYLVTKDSQSLEDDISLDSYLSMSDLKSLLDAFPCKQVFTILDVCYGASFELINADLPIENYSRTKMDNGLDAFISEIDKNYSRIVLASGPQEVYDYWKENQSHSPFASKLIEAFNSEQEFISPGKIFSYVRGNTTMPILKKFGKHEVTGDFLLKVNQ